ncbi:hypothetical protein [Campylobacter sp. RM16704]|uniref:hypothetical protein n=1 Tax=Campylobacter sp. RM16704 TaxID=1500960 RepID=UPI0005808807|nr:hypothetical protein [Campylobacter sp. RM16704]AJC85776.1 hypothetical protein CAQ16704_0265 [Campylobacter sp. RM16704]
MKKIIKLILLSPLAILFIACGKSNIPKCNDETVQEILTSIILDNRFQNLSKIEQKKLKFTYSAFITQLSDQEGKTNYCKAQVKIFGTNFKDEAWIEFTTQFTDDKKEIYVELENYKR